MGSDEFQRKLAAILSADVAGYSRLMGIDEAGTLAALKVLRKELFAPKVAEHYGRIVKLMGDGALVEFPSVVDAVKCAISIQRGMVDRNVEMPEERRIQLRIGVNLGDVIIEGSEVYGDGVNVAARLQERAVPGGIALSATAHEHSAGKVGVDFEDGGEHSLKNIARPIRIYHWSAESSSRPSPTQETEGALPLPDKPSIAVLPFANMSGDPEQDYFSDGITEDIITELSRFRSLFVIARNSTFVFKDQAVNLTDVGRRLGVRYVVEGSVRRAADRVRISAQLVEAASSNHLWAERYDRELRDIFAVQDDVVRTIVATVAGRLEQAGRERASRKPPTNLGAFDHVLWGREHFYRWTVEDNRKAREQFEQAIVLDPQYAPAHAGLAKTHYISWSCGWSPDPEESYEQLWICAERAVALDETDSRTHTAFALANLSRRRYERTQDHLERAVFLNPSDTRALVNSARYEIIMGNTVRAVELLDAARRLDPYGKFDWYRGMAYFTARRYEEAIAALETLRNPVALARAWLTASYAQAGRLDEAKRNAAEFLATAKAEVIRAGAPQPESWIAIVTRSCPYRNADDLRHILDGLCKAGLSDRA